MDNIKRKYKEITLPMILKTFELEGKDLQWSIFSLDVIGDLGEDKPVPEFQKKIISTTEGYLLKWDELWKMANKFEIVIECVFVGCKDRKAIMDLTQIHNEDIYQ